MCDFSETIVVNIVCTGLQIFTHFPDFLKLILFFISSVLFIYFLIKKKSTTTCTNYKNN